MSTSFASLVVLAVLALIRSTAVALPVPLQQMAKSLASVHGYRTVITTTSTVPKQQPTTIQINTVYLRSGTAETTYTVESTKISGRALQIERLTTATRSCVRPNSTAQWSCQAVKPLKNGGGLTQALGSLTSGFKWTAAGTSTINGQPAVGYQAVSAPGFREHITATLWIGAKTKLPVELRSTTSYTLKVGTTTLTEVVDWSQWNDTSLKIPSA